MNKDFFNAVKEARPNFFYAAHHETMAHALEQAASTPTRLIIEAPPRFSKSTFASEIFPAWFMRQYRGKKFWGLYATENLASNFSRCVKELRDAPKTAYRATGFNAKLTGEVFDMIVMDDPMSEHDAQRALKNSAVYEESFEHYRSYIRTRLRVGGSVVLIVTRQLPNDLADRLKKDPREEWKVLSFPAIADEGTPEERSAWPDFWSLEELQSTRSMLTPAQWAASYQQQTEVNG